MKGNVIRFSLADARAIAAARRPGYVEAIEAAAASRDGDTVLLSTQEYLRIKHQYAVSRPGVGTELKGLLRRLGITPTANCACNFRAAIMDARGIDWCEENLDTIVGWLREEAEKRGLPFVDVAGRLIVRRAIAAARRRVGGG